MCRASTDPRGGYRCPKKSSATWFLGQEAVRVPEGAESRVLDLLRTATGNTLVTSGAERVDLTESEGIERLLEIAKDEVAVACADEWERLASAERNALIRDISAPDKNHVFCSIAALIGEVCTWPGKLVGDAATAVGDRVAKRTRSPLAGKMAAAAARRLMTNVVLQASPLGQAAQVGITADIAAVSECPSQHAQNRKRHPAVEESAARLAKMTVDEVVSAA